MSLSKKNATKINNFFFSVFFFHEQMYMNIVNKEKITKISIFLSLL